MSSRSCRSRCRSKARRLRSDKPGEEAEKESSGRPIKAVYVADADLMLPEFSMIRADPNTITEAKFQFQNVTFVLNCIDWLTGETDFIEVRKARADLCQSCG